MRRSIPARDPISAPSDQIQSIYSTDCLHLYCVHSRRIHERPCQMVGYRSSRPSHWSLRIQCSLSEVMVRSQAGLVVSPLYGLVGRCIRLRSEVGQQMRHSMIHVNWNDLPKRNPRNHLSLGHGPHSIPAECHSISRSTSSY